jgi:HEAT repeat protein
MQPRHLSPIFLLALLGLPGLLPAAEPAAGSDEKLLRDAGVNTDAAALAAFLRERLGDGNDVQRLDQLIRQLGSDDFDEREQAGRRLVGVGAAALPRLRQALKDSDPEIRARAHDCIAQTERGVSSLALPLAAARRLVALRPERAVADLLVVLPAVTDDTLAETICFGLADLAVRDGKVDPALVAALADTAPARRALAACLVGRSGSPAQRGAVRKLLDDPEPLVRLRAAQGLLAAGDKTGLPALAKLLTDAETTLAWQAEELLHWAAGDEAPELTVGAGTAPAGRKCRAAWEAWWQAEGSGLDLARVAKAPRRPGLLLLAVRDNERDRELGRVYLAGCDGRPRWELRKLELPLAGVHLLPGGRLLAVEGTDWARERDLAGKVVWEAQPEHGNLVWCRRLPGGNTLLVSDRQFLIVKPDGGAVQKHTVSDFRMRGVASWDRGSFACVDTDGVLRSVNTEANQDTRIGRLDVPAQYWLSWAEPLAGGGYLVGGQRLGKVFEADAAGKIVRRWDVPSARHAVRLPDGHTLLAGPRSLVEVDGKDREVWSLEPRGEIECVGVCLGLVRLGFDRPAAER